MLHQHNLLILCFSTIDTEIDWKAYMQEVSGAMFETRDYMKLKGDTGMSYSSHCTHTMDLSNLSFFSN